MAPINPVQILDAFTPLLTENGGIKPVEDQTQFQKIYDVMKSCSTKLVSKCIYYQILISTSPEVLEQFLKIGGWDLICLWVKSSRDIGNVTFLLDLLKLLHILPMNIDRLRENECPKIVKKLCKHENEQIALKAKQIIKKWTKIIQTLSTTTTTNSSSSSSDKINSNSGKEKKRKSFDNSSSSSPSSSSSDYLSIKKSKLSNSTDTETEVIAMNKLDRSSNEAITDVYETYTADEMNKLMLEKPSASSETIITAKRPVTAKVKPGKFRLDLSVPSTIKNDKTKKLKSNQKTDQSNNDQSIKKLLSKDKSFKVTSPTPANRIILKDSKSFMDALSMMPITNVVKKRRKTTMKLSTTTPTSTSALALNANNISTDNMKRDSFALNDKSNSNTSEIAINNISSSENCQDNESNKIKNEISPTLTITNDSDLRNHSDSGSNDNISNNNDDTINDGNLSVKSTTKSVAPRFSFYKDILDEKCDGHDDNVENDASSKLNSNNNTILNDDSANKNSDASDVTANNSKNIVVNVHSEDEKSISNRQNDVGDNVDNDDDKKLDFKSNATSVTCSVNSSKPKPILCYIRKNSKKRVRWPDDDTDLEKVRYFELDETERINVTRPSADMKRFDMKHEAQMMSDAKKSRCFSYAPWHLIPIDIDPSNILVERGKDSRERIIQMERMQTTLECFYFHNQLPDSADEPDHNAYELMSDLSSQDIKTKIIPLEDENANTMDRAVIQDYSSTMDQPQQLPPPIIDPIAYNNNMPFNVGGGPIMDNGENYIQSSGEQSYLPPPSQTLPFNHQQSMGSQQSNYNTGTLPYQTNLPTNNYNDNNMGLPPPNHQPFDHPPPSTNNNFNNDYNSYRQPPVFNPAPPFSDFSNVPPPSNNNNNFGAGAPQFSNNNQGFGPPPLSQPIQSNDNYWPEPNFGNNTNPNNNHLNPNYPPGGPPQPSLPPPPYHQGPPGPRMFRPRGSGGGPRGPRFFGGSRGGGGPGDMCRFFFKTGKCKFENRCNYSHVMDQQKPPIRF